MSQSIVIVGGSLAGLMQGIRLKRQGHDVTIIEQDVGSERSSYEAGITVGENVEEFLRRYDATGLQATLRASHKHYAYYKRPDFLDTKGDMSLTNWVYLYRILRANYDHLASSACPNPPPAYKKDGRALYLAGKQVTRLKYSYSRRVVTVYYQDVQNSELKHVDADLVIGADGVHSTVRQLLHTPTIKEYAGYVAFRGSIPERAVSSQTAAYFNDRLSFQVMKESYMICYVIPTDDGNMEPGERLLNWVWYHKVADESPKMRLIFADANGRHHRNTVPRGLVSRVLWDMLRKDVMTQLPPPFAELLERTQDPFVTKVSDVLCESPSFYDGHVVLVGDAFATFRPHLGFSTDQAALHSLTLERVDRGEMKHDEWCREMMIYAQRMSLLNRVMGQFCLGSTFAFLTAAAMYLMFMIKIKFSLT